MRFLGLGFRVLGSSCCCARAFLHFTAHLASTFLGLSSSGRVGNTVSLVTVKELHSYTIHDRVSWN